MIPSVDQVHQTAAGLDGIQAGYQVRPLGGNSPVALANLTGAAHMTAHGQHGRCGDIDRVSPQRNGLHDIGRIMDGTGSRR